jgi:hypothetical protein
MFAVFPPTDVDDVLAGEHARHIGPRPTEQAQMRRLGPLAERLVELRDVHCRVAARGRDEADLRTRLARQRQDVGVEGRALGLDAEAAAAHRDDLLLRARGRHLRVG